MYERSLPASPNWYCSRCCDVSSSGGLLGVGAKNTVYLVNISASTCRVVGEFAGFPRCIHVVLFTRVLR